ncbi:MAG: DUF3006 domain-containing protein [Bradymonadales bacterium]|nr:DUF3006 domain-containing protein [Bradymonadales bacterium]
MSSHDSDSRSLTVDRFEGNWAVLAHETGEVKLPKSWLPSGCQEGTLISMALSPDAEGQRALTDRVASLQARFRKPER